MTQLVLYKHIEGLAARMSALGDSILSALEHGEWSPTIYAQFNQREGYYEQVMQQWTDGHLEWVHLLSDTDSGRGAAEVDASEHTFAALASVLQQNQMLQDRLTTSMLQVDNRLKHTVQQRKFEQAYHPDVSFTGGFVAEER